MEIKIINGVYLAPQYLKPIGTAFVDVDGNLKECQSCNDGIAFIAWPTGKIIFSRCAFVK